MLVKKILFAFFLFLITFLIHSPVNTFAATSCIKSAGGINDFCSGYVRCPVGINIYCCDNQSDCQVLQVPVTPQCASAGGTCHLNSDICETSLGTLDCPQFQTCGKNCSVSEVKNTTNPKCKPTGGTDNTGINTAIGCIPVLNNDNGTAFMAFILRWAVGVGGGIAFLLILYGGFIVMTSTGNPERLKAGQELLTSAISGLILLIFSVFILKFIGIDILGLCKFGFGRAC